MLKSHKAAVIEELEGEIRDATALIVADYRGLSVGAISDVRNGLRPLDATLRVSKNTLARIAAERAGSDGLADLLTGPTAIAFCQGDPAAVAKKLSDVARETRILRLKGAVVEGQTLDEAGVRRLATLPPREALQAQVVGVLAAPLQQLVTLLAAAPRELVVVLDQIIQKKQAEAA
jgi:large subunit ribosomal protein L10